MATKRILWLSDYGVECKTGYATVSRNIKREVKNHFGDDFQIDIIAINHFGKDYVEIDNTEVISAQNNDAKNDDFGRHIFLRVLSDLDYDGVFIMQDVGIIIPIIPIMETILQKKKEDGKKQFKSIFYFPVDCNVFRPITKNLEFFDLLVTYTDFARNQILKLRPELKPKIKVINHGNNPKEFYPLPDNERQKFRNEYFGENAGKFIITNVNRNQPRKDIPNTIFGFIEAKRTWDYLGISESPFLYLHCHPKDPLGHDLRAVLNQTDLIEQEDYMLLPKRMEQGLATLEELNGIYNASDLYVTTTLGEGWGLSVTESMACKLPVICPNNTSLTEISDNGERAILLTELVPFCVNTDNIIREQCNYIELAEAIKVAAIQIKDGSPNIKGMVESAYQYTLNLNWKNIGKRWIEYFKEVY